MCGIVGRVLSSCALWGRRCSIVEGPEFDSRIVFGGGERMMSWRSYGFNMCIGMACGCFVGLYVEPVKRCRVCVLCRYGEIRRC